MLFDTYAWVELFNDTPTGRKVEQLMNSSQNCTSMVSLAELTNWSLKNGFEPDKIISKLKEHSAILPVEEKIAILAGEFYFEYRKQIRDWGMIDSIIYATSLVYGLKVVTGDKHFSDLPNALML